MTRTNPLSLLVTLPLVVLPAAFMVASPAHASGSPALEAVSILSRARATNDKCKFLSGRERGELARYGARAEMASASQTSPEATRAAVATGSAQGQSAACNAANEADVRDTLSAAREAIAESNRSAPRQPAPESRRMMRSAAGSNDSQPVPRNADGLGFYARVVSAYYLERECKSLGSNRDTRFWRAIVDIHGDTVSRFGKKAVAPLKARAEANAQGTSCGSTVQQRIADAYEEVSSR